MSNTPMSDTQEKQTQEIYRVMQLPYLSERHDGIKQLIDSAKREELIKIHTFHEGRFMTIEDRIKELEQSEESI